MDDLLCQLRTSTLFAGLAPREIDRILAAGRQRTFPSGECVCRQGDPGETMHLVLSGRVDVSVRRADGRVEFLNALGQGNHFGEMAMLTGEPRTATVVASMDTKLLELDRPTFEHLMNTLPGFAANLSRTLGLWLRGQLAGGRRRRALRVAALVRTTPRTGRLCGQLAGHLGRLRFPCEVLTDRPGDWSPPENVAVHRFAPAAGCPGDEFQQRLSAAVGAEKHVLIDVAAERADAALLSQCDRVYWLVEQDAPEPPALRRAADLLENSPRLGERWQLVWTQRRLPRAVAALRPHGLPAGLPELRIQWDAAAGGEATFRPHDLARLEHQLRGVHLGLALGGGGARGLAHIGVVKALSEAGIYFDHVAGTSAGAVIAASYCGGLSHLDMIDFFDQVMTPPRWVRYLPGGIRWHLLASFRTGRIERGLRKNMRGFVFEQLLVPLETVSSDLVTGEARIRSRGELAAAVVESINHPMFGKPILRDGEALVDGGLLINVPASVLRKRGADFIVSVDVSAAVAASFAGNTPQTATEAMKRPGYFGTLLRAFEVASRNLAAMHLAESDFVITPDAARFPFDDFTQGRPLLEVGEAALAQVLPQLRQTLDEFLSAGPGT